MKVRKPTTYIPNVETCFSSTSPVVRTVVCRYYLDTVGGRRIDM